VDLLLRVDAAGRVTAATVVGRSPCRELDEAARKAALRLRYEPAREGGMAVAGEARLTVRFVLEE
jgi:TonB family protein